MGTVQNHPEETAMLASGMAHRGATLEANASGGYVRSEKEGVLRFQSVVLLCREAVVACVSISVY